MVGSVVGEHRHDEVPSARNCVGGSADVLGLVARVEEEVERRSVVPDVDRLG